MSESVSSQPEKKKKSFWDDVDADPRFKAALRSLHGEVEQTEVSSTAPSVSLPVPARSSSLRLETLTPTNQDLSAEETTSGHVPRQSDSQTVTLPDSQSVAQTVSRSVSESNSRPVIQTVTHPLNQSFNPSDSQSHIQPVFQTFKQPVSQTVRQPVEYRQFADPVASLTANQCKVILFLIQQHGITQRQAIVEGTGVALGTVKDALPVLVSKGFISKPAYFASSNYRGFSYVTNTTLCDEFIRKRGYLFQTIVQPVIQTINQPVIQTDVQPVGQSDSQNLPSSSRLETKTTTMDFPQTKPGGNLSTILGTDPELNWWLEKGLQVKQIETWVEAAQCSEASMIQSLRHFAFDMCDNGRESEMQKDPSNYFYSVIRKAGSYKAPTGYRSRAQRMADDEQELLDRQIAEIKRLTEMRHRREEATIELEFQQILSVPESEAYLDLVSDLSNFERSSKGRVLEIGLRRIFMVKNGYLEEG